MVLTEEERKQFAAQLVTHRKAASWSQQKLADLANVDADTVGGIENGQIPHEATLRKVFDALGLEVTSFGLMPKWIVDQLAVLADQMSQIPADRQHETMGAVMQIMGRARRGVDLLPAAVQAAPQTAVEHIEVNHAQIDFVQHGKRRRD